MDKNFIGKKKKPQNSLEFNNSKDIKDILKDKPLKFEILKKFNKARASILTLPHGQVLTPVYMPVGTKAAMKGLLSCDMERIGCKLMLSNTYHLTLEPGEEFIDSGYKGTHKFMNWKNNLLTDSGGFQMVSLSELSEVTEEGVLFESHIKGDKRKILLTPEKSIQIQNKLGADIIMALDDVLKPNSDENRLREACDRTLRWIDRCFKAHGRPHDQSLFPIVQGGLDLELRRYCTEEMVKRNANGYAIGGLSGGESKEDFWKVVNCCTDGLPENKPRYLMGVGYPVDLVICALLGVDMFDCVFATRTARFGTAFTKFGFHKLKSEINKFDFDPIEKECSCEVCEKYSRSYLYQMLAKNPRAVNLISIHNVYYLLNLMKTLRQAILDENTQKFTEDFLSNQFMNKDTGMAKFPLWVFKALVQAKIDVKFMENKIESISKSDEEKEFYDE